MSADRSLGAQAGPEAEGLGASTVATETSSALSEDAVTFLKAAFGRMSSTLNSGDIEGFLALFHDRALVIDEDSPFRHSKAEFIDHLGFHAKNNWQGFAWVPRDVRLVVRSNTGYTAGTVTFRGKPVDAGFRLRHMMYTIGWSRPSVGADWKIVLFHQAPLHGHIEGSSPGTGH